MKLVLVEDGCIFSVQLSLTCIRSRDGFCEPCLSQHYLSCVEQLAFGTQITFMLYDSQFFTVRLKTEGLSLSSVVLRFVA
jgi:hypothetical protein